MLPRQFRDLSMLIGYFFILFVSLTEPTDDALPLLLDSMAFNHEVRRNPKFIIPSLLASMYQKTDRDSIMNNILSRPFAKKVGEPKKENVGNGGEPRPSTGNHKNEHMNQPKTKSPYVKLKESLANQGEETKNGKDVENSKNYINEGPLVVKKGFSGVNRNWYGESPMLWAPPIPYPNSYVMPYGQMVSPQRFPSYHEARPPDLMENLYLQDGAIPKPQSGHNILNGKMKIGHIFRDGIFSESLPKSNSRSSTQDEGGTHQFEMDGRNKNVIAHERKFVITNVTKYVLDFYCPHCGGEISVSRAKNRNKMNRGDDITVNKGIYSTLNKIEDTKNRIFFPNKTKSQE